MRSNERNPRHPWRSCRASAFENSLSGSVHPCTLPDASFCLAKTSLLRKTPDIRVRSEMYILYILWPRVRNANSILRGTTAIRGGAADPALLQIGGTDTRREHKLTAGVSLIR